MLRDLVSHRGTWLFPLCLMVLFGLWSPPSGSAQSTNAAAHIQGPLRVYLDCNTRNCDSNHFRTEIQFVDWVRDRTDAHVHIIMTSTMAGGGASRYQLDFIGLRQLNGLTDQLSYISNATDVQREVVDGITHVLRLGLVRYAAASGSAADIEVTFRTAALDDNGNGGPIARPQSSAGRWNHWFFRTGFGGDMNVEELRSRRNLRMNFTANRTTEDWKVILGTFGNFRRNKVQLSDGRIVRDDADNFNINVLLVRSVSNHVSVGIDAGGNNSVRNNQKLRFTLAPAIEWNYYPYLEATRRQFIAHYSIGVEYTDYEQLTLFDRLEETVPTHRFALQYNAREAWGNAGFGVETSQYLHDRAKYSFSVGGDVNYRIVRGLSLNLAGGASLVRDQIFLPKDGVQDEEVLLGNRSLPTDYQYRASLGFSYAWGDTFNNVVNTRFPRSVRDGSGPF